MDNFSDKPLYRRIALSFRISWIAAASLLAAGGGVSIGGTQSARDQGRWLALCGYILLAVVLVMLVTFELCFWRKRSTLTQSSRKVSESIQYGVPLLMLTMSSRS